MHRSFNNFEDCFKNMEKRNYYLANDIMINSPHKTNGYQDPLAQTLRHDYPPRKPFINDDIMITQPSSAYPENNRQAVIEALKGLQDKLKQLERERNVAEDNFKSFATETNRYKDLFQIESENKTSRQSQQTKELETQLSSAETRCNLLEKQLDHMRKMVQGAEKDRQEASQRATLLDTERATKLSNYLNDRVTADRLTAESHAEQERLAELEREHLKLTATQNLAENKIKDLEEKLHVERHQRKLIQERTRELESNTAANRILLQTRPAHIDREIPDSKPHQKQVKKKKKKAPSTAKKPRTKLHGDPMKHYRLNLADIPFVAGQSTTHSHSLGANIQKVLSMMKSHNTALCGEHSDTPSSSSSSSSGDDMSELLIQLQDEFGQMSCEHQELTKHINETGDLRIREDLERERDSLVDRMEAKSLQISKVRRYQQRIDEDKPKKKIVAKKFVSAPRPKSAPKACTMLHNSKRDSSVEVTTTVKTKGPGAGLVHVQPCSARELTLNVFKDMKKIQTSLRKDDVAWE